MINCQKSIIFYKHNLHQINKNIPNNNINQINNKQNIINNINRNNNNNIFNQQNNNNNNNIFNFNNQNNLRKENFLEMQLNEEKIINISPPPIQKYLKPTLIGLQNIGAT